MGLPIGGPKGPRFCVHIRLENPLQVLVAEQKQNGPLPLVVIVAIQYRDGEHALWKRHIVHAAKKRSAPKTKAQVRPKGGEAGHPRRLNFQEQQGRVMKAHNL